jgi:hypothetical protein
VARSRRGYCACHGQGRGGPVGQTHIYLDKEIAENTTTTKQLIEQSPAKALAGNTKA